MLLGIAVRLPAAGESFPPGTIVLRGHLEPVFAGAFSPNGKYVVTGSGEGAIRIWEAANGKLVKTFSGPQGHRGIIMAVAVSPDGTQLASAGVDNSAKIWDFPLSDPVREFDVASETLAFAVSQDGQRIVVGAQDGKLRLIPIKDQKSQAKDQKSKAKDQPLLKEFEGQQVPATKVAMSPNQQMIGSGGKDGSVRLWNVGDGKMLPSFKAHSGAITGLVFLGGGSQVCTTGEDGKIRLWPTSFQPKKTKGNKDQKLEWEIKPIQDVALGSPAIQLAYSQAGGPLFAACADGKIRQINPSSMAVERTIEVGEKELKALALSPNNQFLAVAGSGRSIRLIQITDAKPLAVIQSPVEIRSLAFTRENQGLAAIGADDSLVIWNTRFQPGQPLPPEFGKVMQSLGKKMGCRDVQTVGSSDLVYTIGKDSRVWEWKVASADPKRVFTQPASVNTLAFSADGKMLATGAGDGRIRLFDPEKGSSIREINAHPQPTNAGAIYSVAISPDGKSVASASKDQTVKIFQIADGKEVKVLKAFQEKTFPRGHQDSVLAMAFHPDGKRLATGGADKTIKVWNLADGSVSAEMSNPSIKPAKTGVASPAHPGWVYSIRWAEQGKKLVSAGAAPRLQGYLAIWDADSGRLLKSREITEGTLFCLASAVDEKTIFLGLGGSIRSEKDPNLGLIMPLNP